MVKLLVVALIDKTFVVRALFTLVTIKENSRQTQ